MSLQNLAYAITQVIHNFGAATVVGVPIFALLSLHYQLGIQRNLAKVMIVGWIIQAASGTSFGTISYVYYKSLPDIQEVAWIALLIKITCLICGFILICLYLWRGRSWLEQSHRNLWYVQSILSITAISAAAFLRWFS